MGTICKSRSLTKGFKLMPGFLVHGESITDGDASSGVVLTLYESGGTTTIALGATKFLVITDAFIATEDGGDLSLVADSDAGGRRILYGNFAVNGGVDKVFITPYRCPRGVVPKLFGTTTGKNIAIIEGYITEA
jgi:hypothetical protein